MTTPSHARCGPLQEDRTELAGEVAALLSTRVPERVDGGADLDLERQQDLLACMYGLHTLLQLHYLQEEEGYFALTQE